MNFLKTMDLYKGIILLSVLLLPIGGWWVNKLQGEIESCERALRDSKKPGGWLEEIGALQKKIEVVAQNKRATSGSIQQPHTYFEGQIIASQEGDRPFSSNILDIGRSKAEKVTVGKQKALDHVVDIGWGDSRNKPKYGLDFIYAVLFNSESGARQGLGVATAPSVWRTRSLHIQNASADAWLSRKKTPEPEMEDLWYIKDMKFARREPRAK